MINDRIVAFAAVVSIALSGAALWIASIALGDPHPAHAVTPTVSVPTNSTPMFCTASACWHVNPDGSLGQQAP